ncbi:MAG: DMT family transporter [Cuniculiplasma sp.]|jgi:drug/metabolite transporter (DMT)-like permease
MTDREDVILFVLMSTFWASNYPVSSIGLKYGNNFDLLFFRVFFAMIGILVIFNRRISLPKSLASFGRMAILSIFNVLIFMNLWFYSELFISSSLSVIVIYSYPISATLLSIVFLKEKFNGGTIAGIAMGFAGMIIIFYSSITEASLYGVALSFLSSLSWATGTVYFKKYMTREDSVSANFYQFLVAVPPMLLISFFFGVPSQIYNPGTMLLIAGFLTGIPGTAIAYYAYLILFRKHEIGKVSSLLFVVPAISVILSYFILGTTLTLIQAGGMALIFLGILFSIGRKLPTWQSVKQAQ